MVSDEGSHSREEGLHEPESDHDHSSSNSAETHAFIPQAETSSGDGESSGQRRHVVRDSPQALADDDPQQQLLGLVVSLHNQLKTSADKVDQLNAQNEQLGKKNAQLNAQLDRVEAQSSREIKQLQWKLQLQRDMQQVRSMCMCAIHASEWRLMHA